MKNMLHGRRYANATGLSECFICGQGTGQEERWTTSQAVIAQGQEPRGSRHGVGLMRLDIASYTPYIAFIMAFVYTLKTHKVI